MKFSLNVTKSLILLGIALTIGLLGTPYTAAVSKASANEMASAVETRCGWFVNPTPGNAWLNDKDGEWTIGVQGGHQAEGDWPTFGRRQWIKTNGSYGYGCACLRVEVNRDTFEVLEIKKATARPLSACRKDRALRDPSR